jgi:hypothetical protein
LNLIYLWFSTAGRQQLASENKPRVALEVPLVDKANAAAKPTEVGNKPDLTPNCAKELRRTADLLRFFANRIQLGEETQSVVADMRQQEKKISAVCE